MDLFITITVAVFLIGIFAWLGDWTGSRQRHLDNVFWASHVPNCPACSHEFTKNEIVKRHRVIYASKGFGAELYCPVCRTGYEFSLTDGKPAYVRESPRQRKCSECCGWYSGTSDDACPACSTEDPEPLIGPSLD